MTQVFYSASTKMFYIHLPPQGESTTMNDSLKTVYNNGSSKIVDQTVNESSPQTLNQQLGDIFYLGSLRFLSCPQLSCGGF